MLQVIWLLVANQIALFYFSAVMLLTNLFTTLAPVMESRGESWKKNIAKKHSSLFFFSNIDEHLLYCP